MIKGSLETFIETALQKLSLSTVLALFPLAVVVYLFLYVEDKAVEEFFGSHPKTERVIIVCPNCGSKVEVPLKPPPKPIEEDILSEPRIVTD